MKAMVLNGVSGFAENPEPLVPAEIPAPIPGKGELLIAVTACGVCHTELDEIEGRTPPLVFPGILGHQVVGRVQMSRGRPFACSTTALTRLRSMPGGMSPRVCCSNFSV